MQSKRNLSGICIERDAPDRGLKVSRCPFGRGLSLFHNGGPRWIRFGSGGTGWGVSTGSGPETRIRNSGSGKVRAKISGFCHGALI